MYIIWLAMNISPQLLHLYIMFGFFIAFNIDNYMFSTITFDITSYVSTGHRFNYIYTLDTELSFDPQVKSSL